MLKNMHHSRTMILRFFGYVQALTLEIHILKRRFLVFFFLHSLLLS